MKNFEKSKVIQYSQVALLIIFFVSSLPYFYLYLPVGLDWHNAYRPASLALLEGKSPYGMSEYGQAFYNAPWALLPFLPFAIMPYQMGRVGIFIMGLAGFVYIAYKLNASPTSLIIFLTSAAVIGCLNNGNIDWLPMLAFVLPARWGLIFAAIKPQIGIGIAIYWLFDSYREGGIRLVVKTFAPVTILLLISFSLYGFWFLQFRWLENNLNNMSLFPYSLPISLYLLWLSIKTRDARPAMASSPFLAPYVTQFSYAAVLAALLQKPKWLTVTSALLWIPVILRILE